MLYSSQHIVSGSRDNSGGGEATSLVDVRITLFSTRSLLGPLYAAKSATDTTRTRRSGVCRIDGTIIDMLVYVGR